MLRGSATSTHRKSNVLSSISWSVTVPSAQSPPSLSSNNVIDMSDKTSNLQENEQSDALALAESQKNISSLQMSKDELKYLPVAEFWPTSKLEIVTSISNVQQSGWVRLPVHRPMNWSSKDSSDPHEAITNMRPNRIVILLSIITFFCKVLMHQWRRSYPNG